MIQKAFNRRAQHAAAIVFGTALLAAPASAQVSRMPEIVDQIAKSGRALNSPEVLPLYVPYQEKAPYKDINVKRDVPYGPDARNVADVFTPQGGQGTRPVLIFVHGGGFVGGERRYGPDSPFYDNIAVWAVRNGLVGIDMTYRLAPQNPWPAGAEDVGTAIAWTRAHVAEFGGDPSKIFLMGHSAGAVHVASYLSHSEFYKGDGPGVRATIMVSGEYKVAFGDQQKPYFGPDQSRYEERSSFAGLQKLRIPVLLANAEFDPPFFAKQGDELAVALKDAGVDVTRIMDTGHNHMSQVLSINTADTTLSAPMKSFIDKYK